MTNQPSRAGYYTHQELLKRAVQVARDLKSENQENPEYDRALVNFITDLVPHRGDTDSRNLEVALMVGVEYLWQKIA